MSTNYINIKSVSGGSETLIKQDLKFKTDKFIWRVKFNIPLNPATVNTSNLVLFDESKKPIKTFINYDNENNCIEVENLEGYSQNVTYLLHITKNVESRGGQKLKTPIDITFDM